MAIRIFITGGTFDKEYNEITGQLYFNDTHMHDLLDMGRCKVPVEIRSLMMIELGTDAGKLVSVLNYDGMPITADNIFRQIKARSIIT